MDATQRRRLQASVLKWYDKHGRRLPWRESADPYRIWLSEIMLQQTTVAAVVPYFERFTQKFPDVAALAAAHVDDVLRLWEGLGYYSRARNLHKAAQAVQSDHAGMFPTTVEALQSLPGVGRYTAGAIASFAFDAPAPIVEANTERLYARLIALEEDVRSTTSQKRLWKFAESIVPGQRAGDFNQALMDIGSKICRPQEPDCPACPLAKCCAAFSKGLQSVVPVRKPRVAITSVQEVSVILYRRGKVMMRRRTESERWAGMWDFVRFEIDESTQTLLPFAPPLRRNVKAAVKRASSADPSMKSKRRSGSKSLFDSHGERLPIAVTDQIRQQANMDAGPVLASMEFSYSVTRYKVRLSCFVCTLESASSEASEDLQWFSLNEMRDLPLSRTGREIAQWLEHLPAME
jgi:A/G-specific adenine glycosylase